MSKTNDTNDGTCDADCSLREAIRAANAQSGADLIILPPGTYTLTITGSDSNAMAGDLDITQELAIVGTGSPVDTIVSASGLGDRVFEIQGGPVSISNITIQGGTQGGQGAGIRSSNQSLTLDNVVISGNVLSGGDGGGIYIIGGSLTMTNSAIINNSSQYAGGMMVDNSAVTLTNVTVSGNTALESGGGLRIKNGGSLSLINVTVSNNTTDSDANGSGVGGGLHQSVGTLTIKNSIIAGNFNLSSPSLRPDCSGTISSSGNNLIGNNDGCTVSSASGDQIGTNSSPINPQFASLQDNGGNTQTHALQSNSPAIDAGSNSGCPAQDQRGYTRDATCDMGAFEYGGVALLMGAGQAAAQQDAPLYAGSPLHLAAFRPITSLQDPISLNIPIATGNDDAEESATGWMYLNSSDLELVLDSDNQKVGMRFTGVNIPQGATILNAYVQFTVDGISSEATNLSVQAEAVDNSAAFSSSAKISTRTLTTGAAAWTPSAWSNVGQSGVDQRTPDLSAVLQEVVDRSGWSSGNALSIIVTGTGKRVAVAYDGNASAAPRLVVQYTTDPSPTPTPTTTLETDTPTPAGSHTPTPTLETDTPTPTLEPPMLLPNVNALVLSVFANAAFTYDGDGKRVKSVMTMSTAVNTTYFVGTHYEVTHAGAGQADGIVTKYYYAGAQRIAMKKDGVLNFIIGDHLGSTSLVTDNAGNVVSEMRYKAWGEVRHASGSEATKYQYTGQYSYASDFGLHFYNARWYDSYLNHFTQPDTIVPDPYNPQDWNRYAYARNNPVLYNDPSGHGVDCGIGMGCVSPYVPPSGGNSDRSTNPDTDSDGVPNIPDPSFPATEMGRSVREDCLPGNLVECFYGGGVMPSGDYDITLEEYFALLLAIGYDIDNQGPIENYEIRGVYDTPFFNLLGGVEGTICIEGGACRDRSEYNYIAQGAWSAAALEGREGMLAVVAGWKLDQYGHLPSLNAVASASNGFDFYLATHPHHSQLMLLGIRNYGSGLLAYINNR